MKSESETSPAIPPPQEQQPLPPNPTKSESVSAVVPQVTMEEIVNSNGIVSSDKKAIDETEEPFYFKYLDSEAYVEKCRRYESDFRKFLVDMYFSGGDIYEEMLKVEDEVVMTSRWPCTRLYADREVSYIDPVQYLAGEYGEVQEVQEEVEEEEDIEDDDDEEEEEEEEEVKDEVNESVESATAEITPGDISNGGTVLD